MLALRNRVGMDFQKYSLFPPKMAMENIMMAPMLVPKEHEDEARQRVRSSNGATGSDAGSVGIGHCLATISQPAGHAL